MIRFISFLLVLVGFEAYSQSSLERLLATKPTRTTISDAQASVDKFVQPLLTSNGSEQKLLRKTFRRLHADFLKTYRAYSDFDEVFSSGHYDCLTATSLFSVVLDRLNFSYEIIETNYHIFLLVKTRQGDVLMETTDRFAGFVTDPEIIAQRTGDYQKNVLAADNSDRFFYRYSCQLYQKLSPEKLTGLLFFNQAVKAYNRGDWKESSAGLEKANALYPSPRCDEFGIILIRTVIESSMQEQSKADCLVHLKNFWIKKSATVAAN